ncbi:UNVERIFIED_CONTAM: hypothetical protein GTU68_067213 [Idotea baltica]|nr:hypothetical protein [Idotea baltica]
MARAMAANPKILFLDEPTASLDPAATLAIEGMVQRGAAEGIKMIFVTHDIGQAKRIADDVVFLHAGRMLVHSTASKFFSNAQSEQARAYLDGQIVL